MIAAALWGRIRTPRRLCRIAPVVRPLMAWSRACWVRGLSTISAGFGDTQAVEAEQADQRVGMSARPRPRQR
ncbi:hypothetical protein BH24ACT15_BH24ACT15_31920 [soil metagenome]